MRAAHLLILPSRREAMGYVCLEAAALGTPFLVSDYPAAAEFFEAEAQIYLAPETDFVERLATRLVDAMKNPEPPGVRTGVMEKRYLRRW
jgi:glycosyltransferase involved in cell wall biosynthesis